MECTTGFEARYNDEHKKKRDERHDTPPVGGKEQELSLEKALYSVNRFSLTESAEVSIVKAATIKFLSE